jgi:hypothetical protein
MTVVRYKDTVQVKHGPHFWDAKHDGSGGVITYHEPDGLGSIEWEPGHWTKTGKWQRGRVEVSGAVKAVYGVRSRTKDEFRDHLIGELGWRDGGKAIQLLGLEEPPPDQPLAPVIHLRPKGSN